MDLARASARAPGLGQEPVQGSVSAVAPVLASVQGLAQALAVGSRQAPLEAGLALPTLAGPCQAD
jgi:hypothetical protein